MAFTNIKIKFERLHGFYDERMLRFVRPYQYYYAIYEMIIYGSCACQNTNASCLSTLDSLTGKYKVGDKCMCNNLLCDSLYDIGSYYTLNINNDIKAADIFSDGKSDQDGECFCNGHSNECIFNQTSMIITSGKITKTCVNCQHNTDGPYCNTCKIGYYKKRYRTIQDLDICQKFECDSKGTDHSKEIVLANDDDFENDYYCPCKSNVQGNLCDHCKPYYHNLTAENPIGCTACKCHVNGSIALECDHNSGECECNDGYKSKNCDSCEIGYFGIEIYGTCNECNCHPFGSVNYFDQYGTPCDEHGYCLCKVGVAGQRCNVPDIQYFIPSYDSIKQSASTIKDVSINEPCSLPLEASEYIENVNCFSNFSVVSRVGETIEFKYLPRIHFDGPYSFAIVLSSKTVEQFYFHVYLKTNLNNCNLMYTIFQQNPKENGDSDHLLHAWSDTILIKNLIEISSKTYNLKREMDYYIELNLIDESVDKQCIDELVVDSVLLVPSVTSSTEVEYDCQIQFIQSNKLDEISIDNNCASIKH